jgi:LPXTG-motif cell wall-anchored protein
MLNETNGKWLGSKNVALFLALVLLLSSVLSLVNIKTAYATEEDEQGILQETEQLAGTSGGGGGSGCPAEPVTYTIVRKYYTQASGGSTSLDGETSTQVTGHKGDRIDPDDLAKDTSYDGKTYSYIDVAPDRDMTLNSPVTFTQTYKRKLATVAVTHKYYTITDGSSVYNGQAQTSFDAVVGSTINVSGIDKQTTYQSNTYDYKSASPSSNFKLGAGGATVTLTYQRIFTTGRYYITHEYYRSIGGGTPAREGTDNGGSGTGFVGTTLDLDSLTRDYTYGGRTYEFLGYDPSTNPQITNGMTVKIKYVRNIPAASYTINHEYYTITNGVPNLDSTDSQTIDSYVGYTVDVGDIDRKEKDHYDYKSISPASDVTLTEAGAVITLRYERTAVSYTVTHEYYTSTNMGPYTKTGTFTQTFDSFAGLWVSPWDITKVPVYNGRTYGFHAYSPLISQKLGSGTVAFTMVYRRCVFTAQVNVIHKYYTVTDGVSAYNGQDTANFTAEVGDTIDVSEIARDFTYGGNTYAFKSINPAADFTLGNCGATVTILYERVRTTGTYNIVHEYYKRIDGGEPQLEGNASGGTGTGFVGTTLDMNTILKIYGHGGKTYSFLSYDPSAAPVIANGMTVKIKYVRDLSTAGYTVKHEYYTINNGLLSALPDDTVTESFSGIAGESVTLSGITKKPALGSITYTFQSFVPATNPTIAADGSLVITLKYQREIADYTVKHEYYTSYNGLLSSSPDAVVTDTISGKPGDTVVLGDIVKKPVHGSVTYTYYSTTPSSNPSIAANGSTVITLVYWHDTADYTVVHKYYTTNNGLLSVTPDDTVTDHFIGTVGDTVTLTGLTKKPTLGTTPYTFQNFNPSSNPSIAADGSTVITLIYNRDIADYTVKHEYYTVNNGGTPHLDDTVTDSFSGTVGEPIVLNDITKKLVNGTITYTFQSFNPTADTAIAADGSTVITLKYGRAIADVTILHKYYTVNNGGTPQLDGTVTDTLSGGTVGDPIILTGITQKPVFYPGSGTLSTLSVAGITYTFESYDPATDPVIAADGSLVITLTYGRAIADYTVTYKYFTSHNGVLSTTPDGTLTDTFSGTVGDTILLSGIAQKPVYNTQPYYFVDYNHLTNPTITADGTQNITLTYQRDLADYTVKHEYYTSINGEAYTLDDTVTDGFTGTSGAVIPLAGITQKPLLGTATYTYATIDPATDPAIAADGSTVITITYQRKVFKITTFAANGTITETQNNIYGGETRTITYTPNTGFHLFSVTVDGVSVDITLYPTQYTFVDIGTNHDIQVVFEADPTTGTLIISKVIAGTSTPLADAVFDIYGGSAGTSLKYNDMKTPAGGTITISDMLPGDYWVSEVTAPEGYVKLAGKVHVQITAGETTTLVIPNTAIEGYGTGKIKIVKTDKDSGEALSGAVFSVYSNSALTTRIASGLKTNSAGVTTLEGLDPGTYYVVETAAPSGYSKAGGKHAVVVIANETTVLNIKNSLTDEDDYQTGTEDHNLLLAGGALLLLGAAFIVLYLRRRRHA